MDAVTYYQILSQGSDTAGFWLPDLLANGFTQYADGSYAFQGVRLLWDPKSRSTAGHPVIVFVAPFIPAEQREADIRRDSLVATIGWQPLRYRFRRLTTAPRACRRDIVAVHDARRRLLRADGVR